MKKYLLLFIVAFACIGLVACSDNTAQGKNSCLSQMPNEVMSSSSKSSTKNLTESLTVNQTEHNETVEQVINGSFAIHNADVKKNLRPYNAGTADGNDIILYPHNEWKCLTWEFIHVEGTTYQLKNLYTGKTFVPVTNAEPGVALWQQPLCDDSSKYWEFIKQEDETYMIRLKDTDLYVTTSSDETDSPIILMRDQNANTQRWGLIEQYPLH